jgi:hypothetical protein
VTLEGPPGAEQGVVKPLLFLIGEGEQSKSNQLSSLGGVLGRGEKTHVALLVTTIQKEGQAGEFFRFRIEHGNETKTDAASMEVGHDYSLSGGQTLADVLNVDVQPGLYKIGTPVRLGIVRLERVDHPVILHVYWREDDKR